MSDAIVSFFRNETPDHAGRMFAEILAWDDDALERTHDYIQWLFPMRTASPVNPEAPTVDNDTVAAFAADPQLRAALTSAFQRMANFYGFRIENPKATVRIVRSQQWAKLSANWLTPRNHNMLRITRIITSLRLLGLSPLAEAFFVALRKVNESDEGSAIGDTTFGYWRVASED